MTEQAAPSQEVFRQAAAWMARLWSGEATPAEHAACAQWLAGHPDHERAWRQLEVFGARLDSLPQPLARHVLQRSALARPGRRKALRLMGFGLCAWGASSLLRGTAAWDALAADCVSGVGELRSLALPDGSSLLLGSRTAVDLDFDATARRVVLRQGRLQLSQAPDPLARTLSVDTPEGRIEAIGARFVLRRHEGRSRLAVFAGAVAVRVHGRDGAERVEAGSTREFGPAGLRSGSAGAAEAAWTQGLLLAEQMPLPEVLAELADYRRGWLEWDDAVAGLRATGVFSLADTDRALHNLAQALPVRIVQRSPCWVRVLAA